MNFIIRAAAILILISITGCDKEDDKSVEAANPEMLKTQLETLEKAKQVEQVIQDAETQQRQKIAEETQ